MILLPTSASFHEGPGLVNHQPPFRGEPGGIFAGRVTGWPAIAVGDFCEMFHPM